MNPEGAKRGWSTPTHPPYAKMIAAAIGFLAEEGGSTEEAISAYIRAHYVGLPWAHDRFLPYYLSRLTDLGHFVAGAPGRYLRGCSDDAPTAPEPASTGLGEPLAPAWVAAPGASCPAELSPGPDGAPPGASWNCSPASESGSTMSIPEHVAAAGRGGGGHEAEKSPLCGFSAPQPNDRIQQDASSACKRRGRPPKTVDNAVPKPVQALPASEDVRPRRGRPPKKKVTELNATGEDGERGSNPTTPLPVPDNGACPPHICTPPLPPSLPTFDTVDGLDYVLALPNQDPVMSVVIKEDSPSVEGLKVDANAEDMGASSNGEAKNEADESARPSMATSEHPLYQAMIPAPIQNLSDDGGSAEATMSDCMVANNYDRLFPFYLDDIDLANTEEFVATTGSLYMPAYNDDRLTPPGSVAGDPGWCTATNVHWLHAMAAGPSTAELNPGGAPGTSKPSPDSETGSTMSLVEPVVAAFSVAAVSLDPFLQSPPQLLTFPESVSNGVKQHLGGEDPFPVRKRRGRPPKRKINDTDLARDSREITNNAPLAAPVDGGCGPDPSVRRRRGRPRKRPITDGGRSSGDAQRGSGWSIQAQVQVQVPAPADGECYAPMRSSEPAESPPAEAPPSEDRIADNAFLLALLEGTTLELDASIRERLECVLTTPSIEPARSADGEPPPLAWGNGLMAASGSFGTEAMIGWGVAGGNAAVPQGRGRGRPPKGQGRRGRPRKSQF